MLDQQAIRELLQENAYIIKSHINLCSETEKALPLRVYERNLKALKELAPGEQSSQDLKLLLDLEETPEVKETAKALLIEYGLLVEQQADHYKVYPFILKCDSFIEQYGLERFKKVLNQVKNAKEKGVRISNIYGYLNKALHNEVNDGQA